MPAGKKRRQQPSFGLMLHKAADAFEVFEQGDKSKAMRKLNMMEINSRKARNGNEILFQDLKRFMKKQGRL